MEVKDVLGKNDCENSAHTACHMPLLRAWDVGTQSCVL